MALPNRLPSPPRAHPSAAPKPTNPFDLFESIRNNYLTMLENPATEHTSPATVPAPLPEPHMLAAMPPPAAPLTSPFLDDFNDCAEMRELLELVSPEFQTPALAGSDSPIEETPLFTPMLDFDVPGSAGMWDTSPALVDASEFPIDFPPLFDNGSLDALSFGTDKPAPSTTSPDALTITHHTHAATTTELFTMPSTPSLPPASLFSSPGPRAKPGVAPNGHRKGMSAAAMIPLDAPTQPRTYYTDSKTSRKAVPAAFANKRKRDEDEDEDCELEDAIAAKRRQNTLAARRSRQRKAETARQQEELISALTEENTRLRTENELLRAENDALRRR